MDDALLDSGARVVSRAASAARKLAAEIVPMWKNDSAANTMEFTSALKAVMIEGYGPVTGLLDGVYSGKVDESEDGFLARLAEGKGVGGRGACAAHAAGAPPPF